MRYNNGFPQTMAVGENGVTLHDLERTMLSLDRDKNLNDGDREFLMKGYKEERMRYMDSLFAFTEEHRQRLEEVEKLYLEAVRRLEAVVDRMTRREVQKRTMSAEPIGVIVLDTRKSSRSRIVDPSPSG